LINIFPAVVQAVGDEIYGYGYESKYFLIADQGAGDNEAREDKYRHFKRNLK